MRKGVDRTLGFYTHTFAVVEARSTWPCRLLIIRSRELVTRVSPHTSRGGATPERLVLAASSRTFQHPGVSPDARSDQSERGRTSSGGELTHQCPLLGLTVYPCGNFSDTSSLKLVKLKDQ